jgi:hypothetical protein
MKSRFLPLFGAIFLLFAAASAAGVAAKKDSTE